MHPVQERQAPPVLQEVAHLRPVGPGQVLQRRGELGLCGDAVVEPAVPTEEVQRLAGTVPGRLKPLGLLERRPGTVPGAVSHCG